MRRMYRNVHFIKMVPMVPLRHINNRMCLRSDVCGDNQKKSPKCAESGAPKLFAPPNPCNTIGDGPVRLPKPPTCPNEKMKSPCEPAPPPPEAKTCQSEVLCKSQNDKPIIQCSAKPPGQIENRTFMKCPECPPPQEKNECLALGSKILAGMVGLLLVAITYDMFR